MKLTRPRLRGRSSRGQVGRHRTRCVMPYGCKSLHVIDSVILSAGHAAAWPDMLLPGLTCCCLKGHTHTTCGIPLLSTADSMCVCYLSVDSMCVCAA
jgi:hypothetical protein